MIVSANTNSINVRSQGKPADGDLALPDGYPMNLVDPQEDNELGVTVETTIYLHHDKV